MSFYEDQYVQSFDGRYDTSMTNYVKIGMKGEMKNQINLALEGRHEHNTQIGFRSMRLKASLGFLLVGRLNETIRSISVDLLDIFMAGLYCGINSSLETM